ncbi:MAG TPA: hypothetical protein DEB39_04180, partial [Planctomycetaceae bacterium]|nr:hypothetical protein [Planctomycetaceae bacterium]
EILGMIFETDTLAPYNDSPLPLQNDADAGISNRYARGDHVHPTDGLVTKTMVGAPGGVASLDETKKVPDGQIGKGEPGGVAPLDENNLVPKTHLPPVEIDFQAIFEGMKSNLEFVEVPSCFKKRAARLVDFARRGGRRRHARPGRRIGHRFFGQ